MRKELASPNYIGTFEQWIILCGQLTEAVKYLHSVAHFLHNDIKSDNILFANNHVANEKFSVVLIDFNKATRTSDGKKYTLSAEEKTLYQSHCPHLAPEVIEGISKQTCASDIFAVGRLFKQIAKKVICDDTEMHLCSKLKSIAYQCSSEDASARPCAVFLATEFKKLFIN